MMRHENAQQNHLKGRGKFLEGYFLREAVLGRTFSALSMVVMVPSALHWDTIGCPFGASRKKLCLTR